MSKIIKIFFCFCFRILNKENNFQYWCFLKTSSTYESIQLKIESSHRAQSCLLIFHNIAYANTYPYSKSFHQPWNAFYPLPATKTAFFARFGWGEDMKLMTGVAILFSFVFSVLLLRKNNKNIKMLYVCRHSYLCDMN